MVKPFFPRYFITFVGSKTVPRLYRWSLSGGERKVRAAQGAPLPKIEAIGDSRCRQKKITAISRGWQG